MSAGFMKFKRRQTVSAIIKSVVFALSLGILTSSLIIVIQKIKYNAISPLLPILVGVGALLLGGGCLFAILYPYNKRLARRLDNELQLGERTQTMLQYAADTTEMAKIQRSDTDARLLALPKNALKERRIILHIIAPILAIAILLPAILIPIKAVTDAQGGDKEPDFIATDWQKTAVSELIAWVEESELESQPKVTVLERLNELLVALDTPTPTSQMQEYVVGVILDVDGAINEVNTFNDVALVLLEAKNDRIKLLAAAIGTLKALTVKQELDGIQTVNKDAFAALEAAYNEAVVKLEAVEGDTLIPALTDLGVEYAKIATDMDSYSDQWLGTSISAANTAAYEIINPELKIQSENEAVRKYVILKLVDIFDIPDYMIPEHIKVSTDNGGNNIYDDDEDKENPNLNTGGYGNADQLFGSNETVYDPETNTHVPYGVILNAYYAKVNEQLIAGGVSEDLQAFIEAYFSSLYDGSKKD